MVRPTISALLSRTSSFAPRARLDAARLGLKALAQGVVRVPGSLRDASREVRERLPVSLPALTRG